MPTYLSSIHVVSKELSNYSTYRQARPTKLMARKKFPNLTYMIPRENDHMRHQTPMRKRIRGTNSLTMCLVVNPNPRETSYAKIGCLWNLLIHNITKPIVQAPFSKGNGMPQVLPSSNHSGLKPNKRPPQFLPSEVGFVDDMLGRCACPCGPRPTTLRQ